MKLSLSIPLLALASLSAQPTLANDDDDDGYSPSGPPTYIGDDDNSPTEAPTYIGDDDDDVPSPTSLLECLKREAPLVGDDACEFNFDGVCDVPKEYCYEDTDCFDCFPDKCLKLHYDCGACIDAGCVYCPEDGLCSSGPLTQDLLNHFEVRTSCKLGSDWQDKCESDYNNVFSDPLYDAMKWAYKMIKVEEVWEQGITGKDIHVRINDDGVDSTHPEFEGKYDTEHSCFHHNPVPEGKEQKIGAHGTAVASLLLANSDNGEGAVGIAPKATVSACIVVGDGAIHNNQTAKLKHHLDKIDISSNSWGPLPCEEKNITGPSTSRRLRYLEESCPFNADHKESPCKKCSVIQDTKVCYDAVSNYCSSYYELDPKACANYLDWFVSCDYAPLPFEDGKAIEEGIVDGRGGKGIIYVWAAGNDYTSGADVNGDSYANSRFTISVAAVGKDGKHASYSTPGACNFVSAPGGDDGNMSNNIVAKPGGGYHDISVGTSFATPTVSGVVALMLEASKEANNELGWRDVMGILAYTAQKTDEEDSSWITNPATKETTNAVGYHHSNKYGFGIVDALQAVELAKTWTNFGPEKQFLAQSYETMAIANDEAETTTSTLLVEASESFVTEAVSVYLYLDHASRGDLHITLTSPSGTESVLIPGKRPEKSNEQVGWKLTTVKNWMENPKGTWTLRIVDQNPKMIDGGTCMDIDFYAARSDKDGLLQKEAATCKWLKEQNHCADGEVTSEDLNFYDWKATKYDIVDLEQNIKESYTIDGAEACCVCGGGTEATHEQQLIGWDLVVYGHDDGLQ